MAVAIEREETGRCVAALGGSGTDMFRSVLGGVTDSLEAERWADVVERVVWNLVNNAPAGPVAPREEIEARILGLVTDLSPEDQLILDSAGENPGPTTCMFMRLLFKDLAQQEASVAGPLVRGLIAVGED